MNKDKITAMCHKVSSETGLTFNSVMTYYFLENVLRKLSNSKYNDKFIFKGGYILSNIVGLDSRSTVDIDFLIKNMAFDKELLIYMFQEVLNNSKDSSIQYELKDIQEIKKEDEYNGYRVRISCKLDNIRQVVPLDIATGDILTYQPVEYEYKTIFLEDNLKIQAYNLETMLAEKLETIYSKGFLNSRSKDFYDVHLLY
ncbi:nucleotidyl transferase AbiEii/AbiGii toxin family protein, partial [Senegalia sp. (in: firmicutes)]|uniref:nucleotidyl transferase AbiEii/AbiGii toxin family protein n=1 Tax=Senegalia sp. (in: firmicutes) TaxID=1924098 RepID=UPI003F97AFFC